MTKTAFDQIFCFLHLVNNVEQSTMLKQATSTTPDKLFKIRPLANLHVFLECFQSNYIPKQEVTFQWMLVLQAMHEGQAEQVGDKFFCSE